MPERNADARQRKRHSRPAYTGAVRIKRPRRHILYRWRDTYLSQLPENVMENIIRFTSLRPRNPNWRAFVAPEDVLNFARSNYDLFLAVPPMFTSLATNESTSEEMQGLRIIGTGFSSQSFFPRLVTALEENLTEITIRRATFPVPWKDALVFKIPCLKSLSITKLPPGLSLPLYEILQVHMGTLERLEVCGAYACEFEIAAIATFGYGLKSLLLKVDHLWSRLAPVWECIGDTLQDVFVPSVYGFSSFDLRSLQRNCKYIRNISVLKLPRGVHREFETLCVALGSQLESLTMEHCAFGSERLGRISGACGRVFLNLEEEHGCSSSALYEMGPKACRVNIGRNTVKDSGDLSDYLQRAGERCKNLMGITLCEFVPEHAFRALLFHPKPFLVDFKAAIPERSSVDFVFKALASTNASLEEFRFDGSISSLSVLETLLEVSPSLKKVSLRDNQDVCHCHEASTWEIDLDEEEVTYDFDWGYVLRILLQCRHIKEISLSCSRKCPLCREDAFDSECVLARHRNVAVVICGFHYS